MIDRFAEALSIFWGNIWLISAIILTVWLPGNLLLNYLDYYYAGDNFYMIFKITIWLETIFGPLYIGALVYALYQIKSGHQSDYKEAIMVSLKKWGRLFGARLLAGVFIGLGLIVFIIPGIILAVRYCLLDAAVVIEGKEISNSLSRSTELTSGKSWEIFNSALLFFVSFILFTIIITLPSIYFESFNIMAVNVIFDCILDIVYSVLQIVIFLFYWESTQNSKINAADYSTEDLNTI